MDRKLFALSLGFLALILVTAQAGGGHVPPVPPPWAAGR